MSEEKGQFDDEIENDYFACRHRFASAAEHIQFMQGMIHQREKSAKRINSCEALIAILEMALKEIGKDFGTDYADGNTLIAHEALEAIREWKEKIK